MVRAYDHDAGPGALEDGHDVHAAHSLDLEVFLAHLGKPGAAELRGHVGGGGARARRAPGMRAQGGEGARVPEGGVSVDGGAASGRGGEDEAGQRDHRRRGL